MKLLFIVLCTLPLLAGAQNITTVAGTGIAGYTPDGGQATASNLSHPYGVAFDRFGNMFVTESQFGRVRKIDVAGVITTVAGGVGITGAPQNGQPATSTALGEPSDIVFDKSGNYYFADRQNSVILKVDTAGIIHIVAGTLGHGYSGDGGPATAALLGGAAALAIDRHNNLYIADYDYHVIRKVDTTGIIRTIAGNGFGALAAGAFYGDGGPATAAELYAPQGIAVDSIGNVFIADTYNYRIRKIDTAGIITSLIGGGQTEWCTDCYDTAASIGIPIAMRFDRTGTLYFSGSDVIFRLSSLDTIYSCVGTGAQGYAGDGGPAVNCELNYPTSIDFDASGNMYVADKENNRVRKVIMHDLETPTTVPHNDIIGLFPNPVSTTLNLTASEKITTITIANLLGQTVYTQNYNQEKVQVNIVDLPPGIYLIRINNTEVRKFVKQ